ncbi:DNA glycosylase AlkZ-like family protein [Micromonospora sp. RTGN7]|uniref:DNA glycosylase AlkZ-like family protein n=1 Tax=Micromonospora sp. RTGN7 TaxID=3016526 RepID=UPI0029FEF7F3|nr:crosslink repair DNA glycosylase YcaQ family protein [Micromonospora sp. RTGN7]
MTVHHLSQADARRIAVRAQLLDSRVPAGLVELTRELTLLQLDPTAYVAPSADLVLWSRLGNTYEPAHLVAALERHELIELRAMLRPAEDMKLYRADMAAWPGRGELSYWLRAQRDWVAANDACRRDILRRLEESGPLPSRELPDSCVQPWGSSGWTNRRNVAQLLDFMVRRGEVAVAGRRGRDRLWDLAHRVYPDEPAVPAGEAARIRNERRLRALGIGRPRGPECPVEPIEVGDVGEPATVAGLRRKWRVDPAAVEALGRPFTGRAALLSPFDRLLHDRQRTTELFGFDYQLEIYRPAAKRRWGYYTLPILYDDRLIGKLDAHADRKEGVFRVSAVHRDTDFTAPMADAVDQQIRDLGDWLELKPLLP